MFVMMKNSIKSLEPLANYSMWKGLILHTREAAQHNQRITIANEEAFYQLEAFSNRGSEVHSEEGGSFSLAGRLFE